MEIFHGEGEHAMSNMMGVGWRFAGDQGAIETIEIVDVGDHAPGNSPCVWQISGGRSNIMGRPNIFNKGYPISGPQHA